MPKKIIELCDWDDLVIETYKRPYSLQQQYGCLDKHSFVRIEVPNEFTEESTHNEFGYTIHENIPELINGKEMCVKLSTWLSKNPDDKINDPSYAGKAIFDDQYLIETFWHRNFYPDINILANDLYKKGLLKKGKYTILIDW